MRSEKEIFYCEGVEIECKSEDSRKRKEEKDNEKGKRQKPEEGSGFRQRGRQIIRERLMPV